MSFLVALLFLYPTTAFYQQILVTFIKGVRCPTVVRPAVTPLSPSVQVFCRTVIWDALPPRVGADFQSLDPLFDYEAGDSSGEEVFSPGWDHLGQEAEVIREKFRKHL